MSKDGKSDAQTISSTQFHLLLHAVPHLGEKAITRLLSGSAQRRLTPELFLELPARTLQDEFELDQRSVSYLLENRAALLEESAAKARTMRAFPLHLIAATGATYPARLVQYSEAPPPLLYTLGNLKLLEPYSTIKSARRYTFTIAVSRSAGSDTLAALDETATQLAILGGTPVTGHDRPEYQRLALAAQRRGLPSLYVFDRGLREALGPEFDRPPFAAARIRDAVFDLGRDLAVSPFRLDDHCIGGNNRRRDSLIFALSDVVIALDIRNSGAMFAECCRAREQGRPIFVCNGGRDGNEALRRAGVPPLPEPDVWPERLLST